MFTVETIAQIIIIIIIFYDGSLQGCGPGSGFQLDPDSIGSVDSYPYTEFGSRSGSRRAKMTHKSRNFF